MMMGIFTMTFNRTRLLRSSSNSRKAQQGGAFEAEAEALGCLPPCSGVRSSDAALFGLSCKQKGSEE
ncbi:hypothetical protein Acr_14g0009700 [Actinidia rufa]|uniref:Uncharacterized protein n=1 Tax=Actinidia rufa TaxID=165716 RepID=A0A7J0FRK9_9ERIC|nr:hypothetical protein Acr_14g0009700 [Actinidia rufa]